MERKRREMEMQMNADLENARSLFGGASLADGTDAENADIFSLVANPKTKDDFEAISTALAKRVVDKYSTKPLYAHFVEHLTRELCMPLKDLDVKKVSSTLAALGNEKQKQAKEGTGKKGGKGKAKPSLGAVAAGTKGGVTGRGYSADLDSHADALDNEYDDFVSRSLCLILPQADILFSDVGLYVPVVFPHLVASGSVVYPECTVCFCRVARISWVYTETLRSTRSASNA